MTTDIRTIVKAIYRPSDVVEIRAFGNDGSKRVGRFPLGWDLVKATEKEDAAGRECYWVLNPTSLPPAPMADNAAGTKETDVPRRRFFLLDFDPRRKEKIATDAQYAAALTQAKAAREFMGWDGVLMASSGNGVHLLVPVDLPNDEPSKELIKRTQKAIAQKFSTAEVEIECFADAARLVRAYGTLNKKGPETADLKWRRSHLL